MKVARHSQAISLVVALAFIVIITILAVGFAETVRLARPAAASYLERSRADQYARSGVERVIATLNQQTGDTNRNWISQPGQLVAGSLSDNAGSAVDERKVISTVVPLHSGAVSGSASADKVLAPPNLNVSTFRDPGTHLITERKDDSGNLLTMPVDWIYVRKSGNLETNTPPSISASDPIIGRYAYWTDDASSKVNYNIAWGKTGNTNTTGHPTRVDLTALTNFTQTLADTIHNFVTSAAPSYNFFNTPSDARRIEEVSGGAGAAAALKENKFEVTNFNSDPNTTFFNEPRIVLTTRPDRAGWTYKNGQWVGVNGLPWPNGRPLYLRVLKNEGTVFQPNVISSGGLDPGNVNNLLNTAVSETITMLALATPPQPSYMQRTDWPMVSGDGSIQKKYFSNYPSAVQNTRLAQLAINIIDYVRAKESPMNIVPPLVGEFDASKPEKQRFALNTDSLFNSYMGLSRTPYVTEVGAWLGQAQAQNAMPSDFTNLKQINPNDVIYAFKVEVYLPKNYGVQEVDLSKLYLFINASNLYSWTGVSHQGYIAAKLDAPGMISNPSNPGSSILKAGNYAVVTVLQPFFADNKSGEVLQTMPSPRPSTVSFRVALQMGKGNQNLEKVPVASGNAYQLSLPIDAEGVGEGGITTMESDDPRVDKQRGDWVVNSPGVNSLGNVNKRNSVGKSPESVFPALGANDPQRDTDAGGKVSDSSFYMPPPAGKVFTRADGTLDDNTRGQVMSAGELGFIHTGIEACQIVKSGGTDYTAPPGIPWRTLRLQPNRDGTDVVPDWALIDLFTAPVAAPDQYNKYVYAPHDFSFGGRVSLNSKVEPFNISRTIPLQAVFKNSTHDASNLASKLSASQAQDLATNVYNRILAAGGKKYGYPDGYDSVGEVVEMKGVADGGEESEELFRQVANQLTARGAVYDVFSIGQALKQTPAGKLVITGEQRLQSVVERYQDVDGKIHISPVYSRALTP